MIQHENENIALLGIEDSGQRTVTDVAMSEGRSNEVLPWGCEQSKALGLHEHSEEIHFVRKVSYRMM
jgi:hypothetical protein